MPDILFTALLHWNAKKNVGFHFGTNVRFILADNAVHIANISGISQEVWSASKEKDKIEPFRACAEFIVLFRSSIQNIDFKMLRAEMDCWIENGCKVLWVIDTVDEKVWIYDHENWDEVENFDQTLPTNELLIDFSFSLNKLRVD